MSAVVTLTREQVIATLLEVARKSVSEGNWHPVDMAYAMSTAVEHAAETLSALRESGGLEWERSA